MMIAHPKANDDFDETYVDVAATIPVQSNDTDDYDSLTTKKFIDPSNETNCHPYYLSWELVDSISEILVSGGDYEDEYDYYYY